MKFLFVTDPYIIDPLGIGYLSSVLKKAGHQVDIQYPEQMNLTGVDAVCFSATTGQHVRYFQIAKSILPGPKIIFGGPHVTYFPEVPDHVDHAIRGEAETSLLWLIDNWDNAPKIIEPMPLVKDLDSIPAPDRGLIYKFPKNAGNPIKNVMTSRGCHFKCPYCYNAVYRELYKGQKVVRTHSIDRVIDECLDLKNNHDAQFIFFADDEFALDGKRLFAILEQYTKKVRMPYHAQIRIDTLTNEKARFMALSGCRSVTFAIESGSEMYRRSQLDRHVTNEQIVNGAKLLHKWGIEFRTENMIGLPGETLQNAIDTLDLNIKCKPTLAWASLYQPYPGTTLGDRCIKLGLFNGTVDDLKPSFFEDSVLPLDPKKKFVNLQRLFGVVANYPILRRFLKVLLAAPVNKYYAKLYQWWKTNCYDTKLYTY